MEGPDASDDVPNESEAVLVTESRRVLDHQIDIIHTVEDNAAWLLRFGTILLGVLISVVQLYGASELHVLSFVGVASIAVSLVVGIVVYGVSAIDVGPEPASLDREVADDDGPSAVYDAVLSAHGESIHFNEGTLRISEWFLTLMQTLLAVGISLVVAGFLASI